MSVADSLVFTPIGITGGPFTLDRVKTDPEGVFQDAARQFVLRLRHTQSTAKRIRSNANLVRNFVVPDPYTSGLSIPISQSISVTLDTPVVGGDPLVTKGLLVGMHNLFAANSSLIYDQWALSQK